MLGHTGGIAFDGVPLDGLGLQLTVGMASSVEQHAAGFIIPLPVIHTFLENAAIAEAQGHEYAIQGSSNHEEYLLRTPCVPPE